MSELWYSFATRNRDLPYNVQIATSMNFVNWTLLQFDAMPEVGAWVRQGGVNGANIWAPDVIRRVSIFYNGKVHIDPEKLI